MYITDFSLKGFKLIDILGNIKQIDVAAKSQIQILIGTNGCGKSSILSELSPLPANKNFYTLGGWKKLTIIHDENEYHITSSFEKKAGSHSFVKNGTELNISKLSTLQTELCQTHLGYSNILDDLTHGRYKICSMTPTERKTLILNLSPSTPDFIVQLHKQAKSEVRVCKNNLTLLQTRKTVIEEKLISLDLMKQLKIETVEIEQHQINISNDIFLLQNRIKEYRNECQVIGVPRKLDLDTITTYRKKVQSLLMNSPITLTNDSIDGLLNSLQNQQGQYQQLKVSAENNYQRLQQELSQYDPALLQEHDTGQQDCIQIIDIRRKRLSEITEYTQYPVIQDDSIQYHNQVQYELNELFSNTDINLIKSWYPRTSYQPIEKKTIYWNDLVFKKERILLDVTLKLQELKEEEFSLLNGPSVQTDNCETCDYALTYQLQKDKLNKKKTELLQQEQKLNISLIKLKRVQSKFQMLSDRLSQQKEYLIQIQNLLQNTIWRYSTIELINLLNEDPSKWIHTLKMTIQAQQFHRERIQLEKDIQQAQSTIKALEKVHAPAIDILKKIYQEKINQLKHYQSEALQAQQELNKIDTHQRYCQQYLKLRDVADRVIKDIEHYFDYSILDEYVKYLQFEYLPMVMTQKQELDKKMFILTTQLKEQETLRARYTEEIILLLDQIEKKHKLCTFLEMGLSPETGMPHYHILKFINAMLENVNFILSQLWTYPFKIELLKEGDEVNCDFYASCNNKLPAPLNRLSKSQEAGMNFAFYIALVYAIQGTDYPMFFDECDDGFDLKHKQNFLEWIKEYMQSRYSPQLWMVNHDVNMYSGFLYKDIICLKNDNIIVPHEVNLYTSITY